MIIGENNFQNVLEGWTERKCYTVTRKGSNCTVSDIPKIYYFKSYELIGHSR